MTTDLLPPFLTIGEGSEPSSSSRPQNGGGLDIDIDAEREEFYLIWLPSNYGLDSDPI